MSFANKLKKGHYNYYNNYSKSPFQKSDFPIFANNNKIVWFDNGATTHKPSYTIDFIKKYYENFNSNIHRSPHHLSMISSEMFDETRLKTANYLKCSTKEIIFVKGTTEGINLLANSINFTKLIQKISIPLNKITILITNMEHHSNIVPWQILNQKGLINLEYIFYDKTVNKLNIADLEKTLANNPSIKIVSIAHVSNVLGITNPIHEIAKLVHKYNGILIVDGAQGIPHYKVNVKELDCDAYVFSSHKLFGPTGVGIIYCKESLYDYLEVWQTGGGMIKEVTLYKSDYQDPPYKFEAGTPNIADIIAFGKTIDYLEKQDWEKIEAYEKYLTDYLYQSIKKINNVVILGDTTVDKVPIYSFVIPNINDQALLIELDKSNIAIRYGHHCAQPIIHDFGHENVYRASLAPYNTIQEIDYFISIVQNFITKSLK